MKKFINILEFRSAARKKGFDIGEMIYVHSDKELLILTDIKDLDFKFFVLKSKFAEDIFSFIWIFAGVP